MTRSYLLPSHSGRRTTSPRRMAAAVIAASAAAPFRVALRSSIVTTIRSETCPEGAHCGESAPILCPRRSRLPPGAATADRPCGSPTPRHELGHVEVVARVLRAALVVLARARGRAPFAGATGGDLVEPRGHAAVGQAQVAQEALGVVSQRDGQLAQVARD